MMRARRLISQELGRQSDDWPTPLAIQLLEYLRTIGFLFFSRPGLAHLHRLFSMCQSDPGEVEI
ncbi:MAG: hypothetical protein JWM11_6528 [Planctomycetaceae bacterium]|nr:hypothetical protein [Planctomycetaceae bacterium]